MAEELYQTDPYLKTCEARVVSVDESGIVLDRTVFYAAGGGQPGDTGVLRLPGGESIAVTDTRRDRESGEVMHIPGPGAPGPGIEPGQTVTAVLDWDRRYRLMRMHSCLHLMCAVIDAGVTGGQVHDGRGRLDFDLQETLDKEDVGTRLNQLIRQNRDRSFRWITDEELDAHPELVKTLSVQPPRGLGRVRLVEFDGLDIQPCGGTHVASTGEIGPIRVAKIEKKGRHNRRVTVVFDE
ncbi:MAG: alanyl-tRNA editing protein [Gammaproteobacteria bacterium]|nr:MAG: alanyl-tRNA editing protein [Gammaproteobacteria bacterium]